MRENDARTRRIAVQYLRASILQSGRVRGGALARPPLPSASR
jgi:hypothetical protein